MHKDMKLYPSSSDEALEAEAQIMLAGYRTHYPVEDFKVIDVENNFRVQLPGTHHFYLGKIDLTLEAKRGILDIMDHKTQELTSKSNTPEKWAARDQASLYLWAASQIYPEYKIGNFIVNILIRQSEKGLRSPMFPDRQRLERTEQQLETAVRNIIYVADQIEECRIKFKGKEWPSNKEMCVTWGKCQFYQPHTYGWSEEIRKYKYQEKTPYLFPIIK
jgi:hypothetical protein